MDCSDYTNSTSQGPSSLTFEIEEKSVIKRIRELMAPNPIAKSLSSSTDPIGEAINLANNLNKNKRKGALEYIARNCAKINIVRAEHLFANEDPSLFEKEELLKLRSLLAEGILIFKFRELLDKKDFSQARLMLDRLSLEDPYYYWLLVNKLLANELTDEAFDVVRSWRGDYTDNIAEMLSEISGKYLAQKLLEKSLAVARMIQNKSISDRCIGEVAGKYISLGQIEQAKDLMQEIKIPFTLQGVKFTLFEKYIEKKESEKWLSLIKEFDDELMWIEVVTKLGIVIRDLKVTGNALLAERAQQAFNEHSKTLPFEYSI